MLGYQLTDYNRIMETRFYHGSLTPDEIAQTLMGYFHRGNFRVQKIGSNDTVTVQIATAQNSPTGGQTAIGISIRKVTDGVSIQVGQQAWLGVAASIGWTALSAIRNPFSLLGRLDDLAQDIESLQLRDEAWRVIDNLARTSGAGYELSERLARSICDYCNTPNPVGEPNCVACGAPLGNVQPITCKNCGFVIRNSEKHCPNCGKVVYKAM